MITGGASKAGKGNKQANAAAKAALKGVSTIPVAIYRELVLTDSSDPRQQGSQGPQLYYLPPPKDLDLVPLPKVPTQGHPTRPTSR